VISTSSTKHPTLPSTLVFVNLGISTIGISVISIVSTTSHTISTIISIPSMQLISGNIVETKSQPSTRFLGKGKEKEENIDLDEEIVIPN